MKKFLILISDFAMPFDITGRPMHGWVMITEEGFREADELEAIREEPRDFALTLPPK
jgi:hypothetical protein